MPATVFYESDATLQPLLGKTVAIIGYGSQGHAHALNLRDSGIKVVVGLPEGSKSRAKAESEGLTVLTPDKAAGVADVIMVLVPDHVQKRVYEQDIEPNLSAGKTLMFAHGFNIHFGAITPPANVDVTMVAPKSPGHRLRELYQEGVGVPALVAVHQDASGNALTNALAYARSAIDVRLGIGENSAVLSVADDGPGIPESEREAVLERFHRGTGSVPGGSGLGLALVKETVVALGGSVRAEQSPRGGAQIVLELPRA